MSDIVANVMTGHVREFLACLVATLVIERCKTIHINLQYSE
jgi:hypothetical protein